MGDATVNIDPFLIYFTFSRIRPVFSCGRTVDETVQAIVSGRQSVADLPRISVLFDGANYYSLNNRRLYVFKTLREAGIVTTVPARLKAVPDTKRMREKYSPSKCSLEARLMPERPAGEKQNDGDDDCCGEEEEAIFNTPDEAVAAPDKCVAASNPMKPANSKHSKTHSAPPPAPPPRGTLSLADELSKLALGAQSSSDDDGPRMRGGNNKKKKKR